LADIASIDSLDAAGKKVLVRVDFNAPVDGEGNVTDDTRLRAALPTINKLINDGAKVILTSHRGRPAGTGYEEAFSLAPIARRLQELLGRDIVLTRDLIGPDVAEVVDAMGDGDVVLLENIRFDKREKKNDPEFARALADLADVYVNDAFGTAHRAHASTAGVAEYLPSYAGYLMQKEVATLTGMLDNPRRPFVAILGGSKVSDKIKVIPLIKELAGDAPAFGAVNTVLCKSLAGYNTDGYGFLLMLKNAGVEIAGKSVLVLGAGGAGRSCIKKLLDGGAKPFVYERDGARLHAVCDEFAGAVPLDKVPYRPFDILLNCTGIGMHATVGQTPAVRFEDGERPADNRLLSLCETAVDLIYEPAQSEFLRIADSLGKKTVNGGSMLFYQAYAADCIYLQREPSAEEAEGLWKKYQEKTK